MSVLQPFFFNLFTPTVPGAPTGVSASAGNAQATVSFTAPTNDGGKPITSYTATSSPGGFTASGSSSPLTVTGLTNGTAYTFTVYATNSIGNGANSSSSGSVTPVAPLVAGDITTYITNSQITGGVGTIFGMDADGYGAVVWADYGNGFLIDVATYYASLIYSKYTSSESNWAPTGIAFCSNKLGLFITDYWTSSLQYYDLIYQTLQTMVAGAFSGNNGGIALDSSGNVYYTDRNGQKIWKFSGYSGTPGSGANPLTGGSASTFISLSYKPYGLAIDGSNNLYVTDANGSNLYVYNSSGTQTNVVSTGLNAPIGCRWSKQNSLLYIADTGTNRILTWNGSTLSTFAGNGTAGYSGDGGLATSASIRGAYIAVNDDYNSYYNLNVYIPDGTDHVIREVIGSHAH